MLAFSNDYYGMIFRATQSVELFCAYNKITDEDKDWWKWDYSDSPYAVYGYDEFFCEVKILLDEREKGLSIDELYGNEWEIRVSSMEEAMKRLRFTLIRKYLQRLITNADRQGIK